MGQFFLIKWRDAQGGATMGWRPIAECMRRDSAICWSCGVVIYEDEFKVVVCPHLIVGEDDNVSEGDAEIAIPTDWIIERMELFVNDDE